MCHHPQGQAQGFVGTRWLDPTWSVSVCRGTCPFSPKDLQKRQEAACAFSALDSGQCPHCKCPVHFNLLPARRCVPPNSSMHCSLTVLYVFSFLSPHGKAPETQQLETTVTVFALRSWSRTMNGPCGGSSLSHMASAGAAGKAAGWWHCPAGTWCCHCQLGSCLWLLCMVCMGFLTGQWSQDVRFHTW